MELSLRLDTLGMVEMRYLRSRDRYRDWPPFQLLAASRQARVMAFMSKEVAELLHQQILLVESAVGLDEDDEDELESEEDSNGNEGDKASEGTRPGEREGGTFSPALAQALERLNDLARQRLPEGGGAAGVEHQAQSGDLTAESEAALVDEEDALEQLQDAFVQMMEVVRELAEELSTDALKMTGRFRCARIEVFFTQAEPDVANEDDEEAETPVVLGEEDSMLQVELALILRLYEEGHAKSDDLPAVELQLDVDDFERLHETLDYALDRERRSRRRR